MRTVPWDPSQPQETSPDATPMPAPPGMALAARQPWSGALAHPSAWGAGWVLWDSCLAQLPPPAPLPACPTSKRAMFLPSYSLPFSRSVLLMKGLLSLGLPSPAETPLSQSGSPCPTHTRRTSTPQGHRCERSRLPVAPAGELPGLWAPCSHPAPAQAMPGQHPTPSTTSPPHTGRGCHPQEPHAALPGHADTWSRRSASTQ